MVFRLPKSLEKTVIGITGALVIAGAPLYLKAAETQTNKNSSNYSMSVGSKGYTQENYNIQIRKDEKKEVFIKGLKGKDPVSLDITLGINNEERGFFFQKPKIIDSTPLDPSFSKLIILYPAKAKILGTEQEAYILPQQEIIKLIPLSETKYSKKILEYGEKLIDNITPWFIVNPVKDFKDWLIESSLTKEEKEYSEKAKQLRELVGEDYKFEKIEFFTTDKIGYIESARRIKTTFDTSEVEGLVCARALIKIAIGNSSNPDKRATGEWVEVNFLMQGEKLPYWIKKQEIFEESTPNLENLINIIKKRQTKDAIAYDPIKKRGIIYSHDEEELAGNFSKEEKKSAKFINFYSSIGKDLEKEKFSEKGVIVLEIKKSIKTMNAGKFCESVKK